MNRFQNKFYDSYYKQFNLINLRILDIFEINKIDCRGKSGICNSHVIS